MVKHQQFYMLQTSICNLNHSGKESDKWNKSKPFVGQPLLPFLMFTYQDHHIRCLQHDHENFFKTNKHLNSTKHQVVQSINFQKVVALVGTLKGQLVHSSGPLFCDHP